MILKGSQRGGAKALANHLLNNRENDHVALLEVRGFIALDLTGALREAQAIATVTQCRQFLFSLSLNPPENHIAIEDELRDAADRAEAALGLTDQPRAIVVHEKEGRRHAHAVWSRIDAESLTAIRMSHFKRKLISVSKELYLDHGWDLPNGLKAYGGRDPLNFTLAEWQQAKRHDVDPREIKHALRQAWAQSDSLQGLTNALRERGYMLARGDSRAAVVLDHEGQVYALSRWAGVKSKEVRERIGDLQSLPSVDLARADIRSQMTDQMRGFIRELKDRHGQELQPLKDEKANLVQRQRLERRSLAKQQRDRALKVQQSRSLELRKGLRGVWDWLTGKRAEQRQAHEKAFAAEQGRDANERKTMVERQMQDRRGLQSRFREMRAKHRADRSLLARQIGQSLKRIRKSFTGFDQKQEQERSHKRTRPFRGLSLNR